MNSIAVHGATGTQGSAVVRRLIDEGHEVRAIARNPRDPQGVAADLQDVEALAAAYAGVDAVVLQLPLVFEAKAMAQAESVLQALGKAGVPRVVLNPGGSVPPKEPIGVPFVDARVLLWTELPNVVADVALVGPVATYAENLAAPWSAPLVAAGEVHYPLPAEAPIPWVTVDDVAAAIAERATEAGATVQLIAGPADLTGAQVAEEIGAVIGSDVRWRTIATAEYEQLLRPYLGATTAAGIAASYEPSTPGPNPDSAMIRRGTTTLRQWAIQQHWTRSDQRH
jgi:uncharacterized protein YbjT (DUF2867 family)